MHVSLRAVLKLCKINLKSKSRSNRAREIIDQALSPLVVLSRHAHLRLRDAQ